MCYCACCSVCCSVCRGKVDRMLALCLSHKAYRRTIDPRLGELGQKSNFLALLKEVPLCLLLSLYCPTTLSVYGHFVLTDRRGGGGGEKGGRGRVAGPD